MKTELGNIENGQEFMEALVQKAWESETFKQQLVNDPVAAIESATGKTFNVPAGKRIVVRDQSAQNTVYVNIPRQPSLDEMELTEEQLEQVAGGEAPDTWNPIILAGYYTHALVDYLF